jgi:ABC-type Na+ transport system ATPase subunit NatA
MNTRLRKHRHFLKFLVQTRKEQRSILLDSMTIPQQNALCEVVLNVVRGNIPISPRNIKYLHRYKNIILQIADRRTKKAEVKKLLVKHSYLLSVLLKPILIGLKKA